MAIIHHKIINNFKDPHTAQWKFNVSFHLIVIKPTQLMRRTLVIWSPTEHKANFIMSMAITTSGDGSSKIRCNVIIFGPSSSGGRPKKSPVAGQRDCETNPRGDDDDPKLRFLGHHYYYLCPQRLLLITN